MKKELFGKVNGREVYLYTLENSHGMKVTVSSFGALIIRWLIVGIPLAWGVYQTFLQTAKMFA